MGNEASSLNLLAECTIDESPIVSSGDWTLHHAQRDEDPAQLSVYVAKAASATAAGGKKNRNESLSQLELLEKVRIRLMKVSDFLLTAAVAN
jgi:hypothetical protein